MEGLRPADRCGNAIGAVPLRLAPVRCRPIVAIRGAEQPSLSGTGGADPRLSYSGETPRWTRRRSYRCATMFSTVISNPRQGESVVSAACDARLMRLMWLRLF